MSFTDPAIIADVRAKIDSEFGPINPALLGPEISYLDDFRQRLAIIVAEAGIYTRDHSTVIVTGVQTGGGTATGTLT